MISSHKITNTYTAALMSSLYSIITNIAPSNVTYTIQIILTRTSTLKLICTLSGPAAGPEMKEIQNSETTTDKYVKHTLGQIQVVCNKLVHRNIILKLTMYYIN